VNAQHDREFSSSLERKRVAMFSEASGSSPSKDVYPPTAMESSKSGLSSRPFHIQFAVEPRDVDQSGVGDGRLQASLTGLALVTRRGFDES
jgi:hypothetical protein